MQSGITSAATVPKHADWIWSIWLKEQNPSRLEYQRFTHYEFIEDETKRAEVKSQLAKLLHTYHTSSPVNTGLLTQLGYRRLASALTNDQRPHNSETRSGNLIEILGCEFAMNYGYEIPVLRLQYNPNPDQSMKGDDILGFRFATSNTEQDVVLLGEGKFRSSFSTKAVEDAYDDLIRKSRSYPVSMEFVATILTLAGDESQAARVRHLRRKLAIQDKNVAHKYLLFLGTIGQPQNPFEYLEEYEGELLPNLIAVNIIFKNGFLNWLTEVYEEECWH